MYIPIRVKWIISNAINGATNGCTCYIRSSDYQFSLCFIPRIPNQLPFFFFWNEIFRMKCGSWHFRAHRFIYGFSILTTHGQLLLLWQFHSCQFYFYFCECSLFPFPRCSLTHFRSIRIRCTDLTSVYCNHVIKCQFEIKRFHFIATLFSQLLDLNSWLSDESATVWKNGWIDSERVAALNRIKRFHH